MIGAVTPGAHFRSAIEVRFGARHKQKVLDWRGDLLLNQQFRLNLLTTLQGGPDTYKDRMLVIRLVQKAPTMIIATEVYLPTDPEALAMVAASGAAGRLFQTQGTAPGSRAWGIL